MFGGSCAPGKVDFVKHQEQLLQGKIQLATINRQEKKKTQKITFLGIRTHVCGFQTQGTKPLGHQNCKWLLILNILACFMGKTVTPFASKSSFIIRKQSGVVISVKRFPCL